MGSYALLGEKLGHSLSPQLHKAIYAQLGHPYKATALNFLDQVDSKAKRLNAVNCVHRKHGELIGYNTDVAGFAYLLRRHNIDIEGARVAILGAGGSAQAVASVLADGGASVDKIANRTMDKANQLCLFTESLNPQVKTELIEFDDLSGQSLDLIVNTTSLGMSPNVDSSPMKDADFSKVGAVVDIVYNPKETKILRQASAAGVKTLNGLEMLVGQAVYSVEIWFGGNVISQVDMDALTQEIAKHIS